jgi:replication-associated recombination protein RarA
MDKFIDYLHSSTLHPLIQQLQFPPVDKFQHLILYGPPGIGKYTQMLNIVKTYSPSQLKSEKKLLINTENPFYIKISDIHYEVDMDLLGCNSKPLWNDIYTHIQEIIQSKYTNKHGIIVCKNFHNINHELLDIFYSYMQSSIKYIFLTEAVSFLPITILSKCKVLSMPRPSTETYRACLNVPIPPVIKNIKNVIHNQPDINASLAMSLKLKHAITTLDFTMSDLREDLYNILIFNLGVEKICFYLLTEVGTHSDKPTMIKETILFLQLFNNNYRPIYHLEKYVYSLITIVHKL